MSNDVDLFYAHLGECEHCGAPDKSPLNLCEVGEELLFECREDVHEEWQIIARAIYQRNIRRKEADANFRFYAASEEP